MRTKIYAVLICLLCYNMAISQCFPDRHNANEDASWLSCTASPSPNPDRGTSHWVLYELDDVYDFYNLTVWNYNHVYDHNNGVSEIAVDVSLDGVNWIEVGVYNVLESDGSSFYQGEMVGSIGREGQYVLITALENHGGACFGLSEVKIELEPSELLTDITPSLTLLPTIISGVTDLFWTVKIQELENGPTSGDITVIIPKDARMTFNWDPNGSNVGPFSVNNGFWTYDSSNSSFHIWKATLPIQSQSSQVFGFIASYDPQGTSGLTSTTVTILSGSGNESDLSNNIDVETLSFYSEN